MMRFAWLVFVVGCSDLADQRAEIAAREAKEVQAVVDRLAVDAERQDREVTKAIDALMKAGGRRPAIPNRHVPDKPRPPSVREQHERRRAF